jgi:hypothetical protein
MKDHTAIKLLLRLKQPKIVYLKDTLKYDVIDTLKYDVIDTLKYDVIDTLKYDVRIIFKVLLHSFNKRVIARLLVNIVLLKIHHNLKQCCTSANIEEYCTLTFL